MHAGRQVRMCSELDRPGREAGGWRASRRPGDRTVRDEDLLGKQSRGHSTVKGFISYLQSHNDGKKVIVLDHLRDAIEYSLLHVYDPSNLKNAYARHDLLSFSQRLMDAWGDFVQKDTTKID